MILLQQALKFMLSPLSIVYGAIMFCRRAIWESGFLSRAKTSCPCISVGNICWGGTGKSPLTSWLLTWAENHNIKAVVLTRGYGADLKIAPMYVKPEHSAKEVGDEPLMLGLDHPNSVILVDPERKRAAQYAERALEPDLFLLDDGFQHLAVQRHMDFVLLRPADLTTDWNRIIPRGCWREGSQALSRAGAFFIKCNPETMMSLLPKIKERLASFEAPIFSFFLKPVGLELVNSRTVDKTGDLFHHKPYVLLSAVGNPTDVEKTVTQFIGHAPEKHLIFPDHHTFNVKDCLQFSKLGMSIICTRKDAVKLRYLAVPDLWALRVQVAFGPWMWSRLSFPEWIDTWWEKQHQEGVEVLSDADMFWNGFSLAAVPSETQYVGEAVEIRTHAPIVQESVEPEPIPSLETVDPVPEKSEVPLDLTEIIESEVDDPTVVPGDIIVPPAVSGAIIVPSDPAIPTVPLEKRPLPADVKLALADIIAKIDQDRAKNAMSKEIIEKETIEN